MIDSSTRRSAAPLHEPYGREKRGSVDAADIILAPLLTILFIAALRIVFDVDAIGWIDAGVDWVIDTINRVGNEVGDGST